MANIELLGNVLHRGIQLNKGIVVSDSQQGLTEVVQNLIDRGLAKVTEAAATHTAAVVDAVGRALPIAAAAEGQAPRADEDAARKAQAKGGQVAADRNTQSAVNDQANKEAQVKTVQPTPADVAATAAQVS